MKDIFFERHLKRNSMLTDREKMKFSLKCIFLVVALTISCIVYLLFLVHQLSIMHVSINKQFEEFREIVSSNRPQSRINESKRVNPPSNEVSNHYKQTNDQEHMEWLDRQNAAGFNNTRGDGTCAPNKDREVYRTVLKKWHKIATELNIRYFLDYGALLGAWWDEELIPWDHDMDIRIHIDDFQKLLPYREKRSSWHPNDGEFHIYVTTDWRLPQRMRRRFNCLGKTVEHYVDQCSFTHPYARLIRKHGHVDIFVYTEYNDVIHYLPADGNEFLKRDIFPLVKCRMMGMILNCPRNPKEVLDILYEWNLLPRDICSNGIWNRNPAYFGLEESLKEKRHEAKNPYNFV